jgi:uracil-DNA glycosylase family 4
LEQTIVKPQIVVALGATALRSVSGKPLAIKKVRGRLLRMAGGGRMLATIHPSYILRIEDENDKRAQYKRLVADLKVCAKALAAGL